jgi:hypothetical protein
MADHRISGKAGNHSYVGYTLNMTSLRWLQDSDYAASSNSKSLWWHYLVVIVPNNLQWTRNSTLWITGGSVTDGPPSPDSEDIVVSAALAMSSGMITGALFQVCRSHLPFEIFDDANISISDPQRARYLCR